LLLRIRSFSHNAAKKALKNSQNLHRRSHQLQTTRKIVGN
jgi:hypothetical protein